MSYRISEFSNKCDVNKETIRYYEKQQLLSQDALGMGIVVTAICMVSLISRQYAQHFLRKNMGIIQYISAIFITISGIYQLLLGIWSKWHIPLKNQNVQIHWLN